MARRVSPPAVHVVRIHYRHWGNYSGFNQFARFLDRERVRLSVQRVPLHPNEPRWLDRLSKRIAEKLAGGRCVTWYTSLDVAADALIFARALMIGTDVIHYLDGDHSIGFLPDLLRRARSLRRRPRVVATFHQPPDWLADIVREENLRSVDRVTVVSRDQQEFFERLAPRVPVSWIPHGIDVDFFHPPSPGTKRPGFRCITVGSWFRDYAIVLQLAERMRRFSDIEFHLVSSGIRGEVPGNVVLHRGVDDATLRRLYQEASALLLPLKNATANNALLEGIACGLPVIVTDLSAIRDYVPGEEAIRIPGNALEEFESAILRLRDEPDTRARLSRLARERALTFGWGRIAPRIEDLYRDVCDASPAERAEAS
ncbi:MAG: glycosyltransferase [Candidatus Eisenbacteria bacterium]|nr:glycosyltransferase [Candidatus Eisenbacteria bacterium]